MNLSKSRYTKGVQCPRMLWLDQHHPEWFDDSVMNQSVLETGSAVGDLAMGYYGAFVEVPFAEGSKQPMLDDTQRMLAHALDGTGPANICEASFAYDGNFCSVDILRVEPDGVHIVEVKSSTHVNEIYYHDMAFQTWVLDRCGLNVKSVSLMHLDSSYVRQGDLDLQRLFKPEDCTERVMAMQAEVGERIPQLKAAADQDPEPTDPIGCQCKKPYPCGYREHCWAQVEPDSIFQLNRMSLAKGFALRAQGVRTMSDALDANVKLNNRQRVQAVCSQDGRDALIDREGVATFLATLEFPLYFLDFETFQPAIPPFDDASPYQQIPSQYSLHVVTGPEGPTRHFEFLAEAGSDPRRAVAEHLVADIPADACTLAYNMSFEQGRIREMARLFPNLAEHLMSIADGMRDLIVPFRDGTYYASAMGGSNSIKAVLPALFPDDPSLDYHALEGVHNGSEAMAVYADLADMDPEQAAATREQLLRYCELDTLAMVRIWEKLRAECL